MTKIVCPNCKRSEGFDLIREIRVITNLDNDGNPIDEIGSTMFANETDRKWLNCVVCGHSWRTQRWFDIEVEVR